MPASKARKSRSKNMEKIEFEADSKGVSRLKKTEMSASEVTLDEQIEEIILCIEASDYEERTKRLEAAIETLRRVKDQSSKPFDYDAEIKRVMDIVFEKYGGSLSAYWEAIQKERKTQ
jgi:hypothetical protein